MSDHENSTLPRGVSPAAIAIFNRVPCLTYCYNCREPLSGSYLNELLLDPYYESLVKALGDGFACASCCAEAKAHGDWLDALGEDIF